MAHTIAKIPQIDKSCNDNRSARVVSEWLDQRTLPIVVTTCLSNHAECTQEYVDVTNSFIIRCVCSCHSKDAIAQRQSKTGSTAQPRVYLKNKAGKDKI
jgi:hypothetical protein